MDGWIDKWKVRLSVWLKMIFASVEIMYGIFHVEIQPHIPFDQHKKKMNETLNEGFGILLQTFLKQLAWLHTKKTDAVTAKYRSPQNYLTVAQLVASV